MARMYSLRAQNDAVEAMIDQIFGNLGRYRSDKDAVELSAKLGRLSGLLRNHFALEDILYPLMIESDHREAAVMARVFRKEHVNFAAQFDRFMERWSNSATIAAALRQFEFEAGMLFAALRERIDRERRQLYPLAEALAFKKPPLALACLPERFRLPA